MTFASKAEADAHDRIMEAAAELSELIEQIEVKIDETDLETLTIYLAQHAGRVKEILKRVKTIEAPAAEFFQASPLSKVQIDIERDKSLGRDIDL